MGAAIAGLAEAGLIALVGKGLATENGAITGGPNWLMPAVCCSGIKLGAE